jgi:DNA-binding CsgD family transcriptional regulator
MSELSNDLRDLLDEAVVTSELAPALFLLGNELEADAGLIRMPRTAVGRLAEDVMALPRDSDAWRQVEAGGACQIPYEGLKAALVVTVGEKNLSERGAAALVLARTSPFSSSDIEIVTECEPVFATVLRRIRRFDELMGHNLGLTALIEKRLGASAALANAAGDILWMSGAASDVLGEEGRGLLQEHLRQAIKKLVQLGDSEKFSFRLTSKNLLFGEMTFVRESPQTSVHYVAVELHGADMIAHSERLALTRSEREVHELLKKGLRYEEIAKERFVSIETVRTHVRALFRKLGVSSRIELIAKARGG